MPASFISSKRLKVFFLVEALQPEHILCRILWIVENTLNIQLLEKSINLLLAIAESKQDVVAILLPPLMKLGLHDSADLLSVEISKLTEERPPERYSILDLILQTVEALSVIDDYSQEICSNKELLQLLVQLIKHPDKAEFANPSVTASVLTANILTDATDLALRYHRTCFSYRVYLMCFLLLLMISKHEVQFGAFLQG
ncbi:hypothetical protein HAX54_027270 [Datura stramonium]|uniref:Uncharacterized protein n=1 Tax=Datura stramonium TaxID=4076 RepID=A0ABS8V284_DATST|nr:hypothetical protein [Datura stramonium]